MKLLFLLLFGMVLCSSSYGQTATDHFYYTCKVWGFLNYYHPNVLGGIYDWDKELIHILEKTAKEDQAKKHQKILSKWVKELGEVLPGKELMISDSSLYTQFPNLGWINQEAIGKDLSKQLIEVKNCRRGIKNSYCTFSSIGVPTFNVGKFQNFDYRNVHQRLLYLFRFWNTIEYFYPYKYLMDEHWDDVLRKFIPMFIEATTEQDLHKTFLKLTAKLNDSHAFSGYQFTEDNDLGSKYRIPVFLGCIDNQYVVTRYYTPADSVCGLKPGDIITSINGKPITEALSRRKEVTPHSNHEGYGLLMQLLSSNQNSIAIECVRNGEVVKIDAKCPGNSSLATPIYESFKLIDSTTGYINSEMITNQEVHIAMQKFATTKGIVIDLRGYPRESHYGTLAMYLLPKGTEFTVMTMCNPRVPGLFYYNETFPIGYDNPNYYKGKIIILVNNLTQSHAELCAMAYQTAPNCKTIGSITAGADGNVTTYQAPDGFAINFTSLGIYYPDKGETQRVGVRLDEEVRPTVKGLREGRDELLERAIEIINSDSK